MTALDPSVLEELRAFSSPSIANGIETFDVRPRNEGYMDGSVHCMFPELGVLLGYAATATIRAATPGESANRELWAHLASLPEPRIVVIEDLDAPKGVGSFWGEVNANIHQAFGALGVITDGCVRDLDEMRGLGFHAFAGSVGVSHGYVHVVDVGVAVTVGGLVVQPGDLLLGDEHGVISIPPDIAAALPEAIRKIADGELGVIALFRGQDFRPENFLPETFLPERPGGDVRH